MSKKRKWVLMALCVLFLVLDIAIAAVLGVSIWRDQQGQISRRDALARQVGIRQEMDAEQQQEAMMLALGEANRLVTLRSEAEAQQGMAGVMLSNAEANGYAIAMELVLLATGEIIAQTDLVDPGWRVEEIPLSAALAAGEHQCLARIHFYTLDAGSKLGTMARQMLLTVK